MADKTERRYDIDWLRLMAVFLLFFFHSTRIFDPTKQFYIHNSQSSQVIYDTFIRTLEPWQMSLFFLLAGASTYFALHKRSGKQYTGERFKRLFIPFVFGVLVLIPPQSYLGLLNHNADYSSSFFSWYPNFFKLQFDDMDGYFMGGHTWGHLWFILHLFLYSLIAAPLFLWLNKESGRRWVSRIAGAFTKPGVLFLFPLWLVLMDQGPEIAGGNPLFYISFFIYGFLLMSDHRFEETIDKYRIVSLIIGPVIFAILVIIAGTGNWPQDLPEWANNIVDGYVDCFVPWFVILALLTYGRRFLNFSNRFLKYFAESSYPLYILHQTVIVIIGYYIVQSGMAVSAKYVVIVLASVAASILAYDILVRRTNITRFLFGMKSLKKQSPTK